MQYTFMYKMEFTLRTVIYARPLLIYWNSIHEVSENPTTGATAVIHNYFFHN